MIAGSSALEANTLLPGQGNTAKTNQKEKKRKFFSLKLLLINILTMTYILVLKKEKNPTCYISKTDRKNPDPACLSHLWPSGFQHK